LINCRATAELQPRKPSYSRATAELQPSCSGDRAEIERRSVALRCLLTLSLSCTSAVSRLYLGCISAVRAVQRAGDDPRFAGRRGGGVAALARRRERHGRDARGEEGLVARRVHLLRLGQVDPQLRLWTARASVKRRGHEREAGRCGEAAPSRRCLPPARRPWSGTPRV
jgi:hypothetical protein